jgi:lysophospholipase L1-like esterase
MTEIRFCGGSSVWGLHDDRPHRGFTGRIKTHYEASQEAGKNPAYCVQIDAKHGRTLPEVVSRLSVHLSEPTDQRRIVVCIVGASDQRLPQVDAPPVVALPKFRQSLKDLGSLCAEKNAELVMIGFHPIDDNNTQPFPVTKEYFSDGRLKEYTAEVETYANGERLPFIPTWEALGGGTKDFDQYVSWDGLHLNAAGHIAMVHAVLPSLDAIVMRDKVAAS